MGVLRTVSSGGLEGRGGETWTLTWGCTTCCRASSIQSLNEFSSTSNLSLLVKERRFSKLCLWRREGGSTGVWMDAADEAVSQVEEDERRRTRWSLQCL